MALGVQGGGKRSLRDPGWVGVEGPGLVQSMGSRAQGKHASQLCRSLSPK